MNGYLVPSISMTTATILAFIGSQKLHRRFPKIWLAPIMITPLILVLGLQHRLTLSLVPRSITTPLAMDVSSILGGVPVWTATFVIITGVFGSVIGPWMATILNVNTPIGKGTMLGVGAHGIGTAAAFKWGEAEGTIASLSMVLAGCTTVLVAPWVVDLVQHLF